MWGIGTGTTLPDAKFQINSITTRDPLRVQVNTKTKFLVHKAGGVSIGANVTPPANGLYVAESIGIGIATPNSRLHINSTTNQDPLRLQVNGATKLLVHRSGGVAIGAEVINDPVDGFTPPVDGLYVKGSVGIGPNSLSNDVPTKLTIGKEEGVLIGISTIGETYGLSANGGEIGVYSAGSTAVRGEGNEYGVIGLGSVGTGVVGNGSEFGVVGASLGGVAISGSSNDGYGGYFISETSNGIRVRTNNGVAYAGSFEGDIFASGFYEGSDKNIKKNIEEMGNATSLISQLKPKYYQFRNDGKYASLVLPKGNHYGLLAQDVEEVLPNLVKETLHEVRDQKPMTAPKLRANGQQDLSALNKEQASKEPKEKISIKAVNYTELIPIMIKSMQEQQAKIEELTLLVQKLSQKDNSAVSIKPTDAYLSYSNPNPNSVSARINYNIPSGATKAHLVITNATGQQLKKITLNNYGSVEVNTTSLSAGIYFYSLFIDDNLFETKKMVIAR